MKKITFDYRNREENAFKRYTIFVENGEIKKIESLSIDDQYLIEFDLSLADLYEKMWDSLKEILDRLAKTKKEKLEELTSELNKEGVTYPYVKEVEEN